MKAIVYHEYGSPDVLELEEIDRPVVKDDEVLVRVRASSANPADWHFMRGVPYVMRPQSGLRKPKNGFLGRDIAGEVEAVGKDVTGFLPSDEVFANVESGGFAEYASVSEGLLVAKPVNLTFEQAAAVPLAALTALQGLRHAGLLQPEQKVLIIGASGGVGTFAVQIAKSLGADVTGVCSTRNVEIARSIGADHVIDYTQEDFTRNGRRYDLVLDIAGNRSWSELERVLSKRAAVVVVGGPKTNRFVGPLGQALKLRLASLGGSRKVAAPFLAKMNKEDMAVLQNLLADGKVTPVIDRRYELSEVPEALSYLGEGHAQGKIVINV